MFHADRHIFEITRLQITTLKLFISYCLCFLNDPALPYGIAQQI